MRALRHLAAAALALLSHGSHAHSTNRNPLNTLAVVEKPSILTSNHRVTALSTFDLAFDLHGRRIRLGLEPNHDILPDGATVQYLGPDGEVIRREPIDRLEHKVYKGTAWRKRTYGDGWDNVGWARVVVRRDGVKPLFEGAFTIAHDHHHIQMSTNYLQTKHPLDPGLEQRYDDGDEFMVCWRDSDISPYERGPHGELRKRVGDGEEEEEEALACGSDALKFNTNPDHPLYTAMLRRSDSFWGAPISSLFGKRQIDNNPGSGNSAGVNLTSTIGQTNGCPTTRKVALVGVVTDCTYTGAFNSSESARQNVITQMNTASSLYESTFNITLGLQNLTVSDPNCPGSAPAATPWNLPCSSSVDIQDRLNIFSQWRGTQVDTNSHWTLLSTCNTGSAVGLAWLGQACVQGSQSTNATGGSTETVAGANVVIRTSTEWQVIAHETGHTFGAVHDCTSQTCSDGTAAAQQCCPLSSNTCDAGEKYIMNPSTAEGITKFSPCSVGNICSAIGRNSVKTSCLTNNKGVTTITGQQCGNGIVEEGEDCDCGGADNCGSNACCDPTTCKFKPGAVCDDSNEDCCHNCQLAAAGVVCRASTGVCDPAETCSGSSAYCPADVTSPDGQSCGSGLTCTSGQCTSRDLQCKTVMGSYTQGNDTYACDGSSCTLSCASPEFGSGVCYGLQQNFLDGTTCGGGGKCENGVCKGSSFTKEVGTYIKGHKTLIIGLAAGLGGFLLLLLLSGIASCLARRRRQRRAGGPRGPMMSAWPQGAGPYNSRGRLVGGPPGVPPPQQQMGYAGGYGYGPGPQVGFRSTSVRYA